MGFKLPNGGVCPTCEIEVKSKGHADANTLARIPER
jgi:hypothetical protein